MTSTRTLQHAILKTICYADVFDYPLTRQEVYRWLIGPVNSPALEKNEEITHALRKADYIIKQTNGYYYLRGRSQTISMRNRKTEWVKDKMTIATRVGKWLGRIPTVRMVAITGALAMENTDKNDDIDIFIVASRKRLWITRLLVIALVALIAQRRKPTTIREASGTDFKAGRIMDPRHNNKICLNLFLDEDTLTIPPPKRNLYTAHEVVQIKPIVNKDGMAERFLGKNQWARQYLPNSLKGPKEISEKALGETAGIHRKTSLGSTIGNLMEQLAYRLQRKIMESRKTTEMVQPQRAFFHPRRTADQVLEGYRQRLKRHLSI